LCPWTERTQGLRTRSRQHSTETNNSSRALKAYVARVVPPPGQRSRDLTVPTGQASDIASVFQWSPYALRWCRLAQLGALIITLTHLLHRNPIASVRRNVEPLGRLFDGFLLCVRFNSAKMFGAFADNVDAPAGHLTKHLSGQALARWLLFPVGPALDHSFRFDVSDIGVPDKDCDAIPFPHFVVEFCARHTPDDCPVAHRTRPAVLSPFDRRLVLESQAAKSVIPQRMRWPP
jgi:hypothetical protein